MIKIAVLLTVYNRREVTLQGLRSLYKAIDYLEGGYFFDIYMTDDGCTDGTSEAVAKEFPNIIIVKGDGNLFWSGGMRMAWLVARRSKIRYDKYLWFNDDAVLFENALKEMIASSPNSDNVIVSGAFCDELGRVAYGGRNRKNKIITPSGEPQPIFLMNGNLVLIPQSVVYAIGIIDSHFVHALGDWDYGCRAAKAGFSVVLSRHYVGITNRHDDDCFPFWDKKKTVSQRMRLLRSRKNSPIQEYVFYSRHFGILVGIWKYIQKYLYALIPFFYKQNRYKAEP